jgi:hypothetical protein
MKKLKTWLAIGSVVGAALCVVAPLGARTATIPTGNLVQNPGAEGSPGTATSTDVAAPAGWTTTGGLSAVQYTTSSGFLTPEVSAKVGGGANFFAGGPKTGVGTATQPIDVSAASAEIDGGGVTATLSALLGGYLDQSDSAIVEAAFLDASGARLGSMRIGPVRPADRKSETTLVPRSGSAAVPKGTVQIVVSIAASRQEGDYDDGYVDNVSLELSRAPSQTHRTSPKRGHAAATLAVTCAHAKLSMRVRARGKASWVRFSARGRSATDRKAPFAARFSASHGKVKVTVRVRMGGKTVTVAQVGALLRPPGERMPSGAIRGGSAGGCRSSRRRPPRRSSLGPRAARRAPGTPRGP